jgi:hypothetical protein
VRRQVLTAVTPEFLGRLLLTRGGAEGEGASGFQSVAAAIIACLAQDATLLPLMASLARPLMNLLDAAQVCAQLHEPLTTKPSRATRGSAGPERACGRDVIYKILGA